MPDPGERRKNSPAGCTPGEVGRPIPDSRVGLEQQDKSRPAVYWQPAFIPAGFNS